MHEKVLPQGSRKLLKNMTGIKSREINGWTLAGGTGLALQLGHRISNDFDFFRPDKVKLRNLQNELMRIGPYEILNEDENTLSVILNKVKMSFFITREPFLFKAIPYHFFKLAGINDIALMKLLAVSQRGSRKDFVDLYMILRGDISLREYLEMLPKKYGAEKVNAYHILKSLAYLEDAEREPMPRMLIPFDWNECRNFFTRESTRIFH